MKGSILTDKIQLLLSAACIAVGLVFLAVVLEKYLALSKGWQFFLGGSIVYNLGAWYLFLKQSRQSHEATLKVKLICLIGRFVVLEFPVFIFFVFFFQGWLPLPENMFLYWLGSLAIAPVMVEIAQRWIVF
jgi:hypothetical protein